MWLLFVAAVGTFGVLRTSGVPKGPAKVAAAAACGMTVLVLGAWAAITLEECGDANQLRLCSASRDGADITDVVALLSGLLPALCVIAGTLLLRHRRTAGWWVLGVVPITPALPVAYAGVIG